MSKSQTVRLIKREISELNRIIDLKIIKGFSYAREAKRHKFLMSELKELGGYGSWFKKSFSFLTSFIF